MAAEHLGGCQEGSEDQERASVLVSAGMGAGESGEAKDDGAREVEGDGGAGEGGGSKEEEAGDVPAPLPTRSLIYAVDLNGHFTVAVTGVVEGVPTLIMFNTTDSNYLSGAAGLITAAGFDFAFPPGAVIT